MCTVSLLVGTAGAHIPAPDQHPELLSYDELASLSAGESADGPAGCKLETLLSTPVIDNAAARSGARPKRPHSPGFGPVLRVALWNLEGGQKYELIRAALTDAGEFRAHAAGRSPRELESILAQADDLQNSDVLALTEVDLGMRDSGYRNVAADLARELGMNLAFGVEFVDADPRTFGLEPPKGSPKQIAEWRRRNSVSPAHYRGILGNAILSRYPIAGAKVVRLPACYDWYGQEKEKQSAFERGKRWTMHTIFGEKVVRQVRHGGRMALIVELAVPESPAGTVTVVTTHLENRAKPRCRRKQMSHILAAIRDIKGPVVLAGDMNTTGRDITPVLVDDSARSGGNGSWLAGVVKALSPASLARMGLSPLNHFKNYGDPSMTNIPVLLPNRESRFFSLLEQFRFADGGRFDFSGSVTQTRDGTNGKLANSNDRTWKGFAPTFALRRTFNEVVGVYKLDWFFVKPYAPAGGQAKECCFAPHRPLTLNKLNEAPPKRISDHAPLIVDLYLNQRP